ncbi:bifunctional DNA primase/polymerase [Pseudonocardia sp. ICBG162]|uniref:bifunctional DNA primase/polymerase n=1 Tax=Pseudonocardia sp. ICBG162 TaxID=2846761 RepID=UPI001CF6944C|nr:bifunctional DNA primase/polymerase [Pseudonocardia sp. ICBG162]
MTTDLSGSAPTTAATASSDAVGPGLGWRGRAALQAARAGLFVFPLWPGTKRPAVPNWEQAATRDPEQITAWWEQRPYNLAIATGPSGLVVIDLDHGRGQTPPPRWAGCSDGADVLAQLAREAGQGPPWATYMVSTPTGQGRHLYFQAPTGSDYRNSAGRLGWHVDVRAHGGYVVAATSTRPDGTYRARNRQPIAALPPWLASHLDDLATPSIDPTDYAQAPEPVAETSVKPTTGPVPQSVTPDRLGRYVDAAVTAELAELAAVRAGDGLRHHARLKAARTLGRLVAEPANGLSYPDARAKLLSVAAGHVGVYRAPDGRIKATSTREITRDIDDGLAFGMALPRRVADELNNRPGSR